MGRHTGGYVYRYCVSQALMEASCVIDSPLGFLEIREKNEAIVAVLFHAHASLIAPSTSILENASHQISAYFADKRTSFDLPLQPEGTEFQKSVWRLLQQIPFGKTESYRQLAERFGDVKAIRAVAAANGKNPIPLLIPCHRVIGSDGSLTGYLGGMERKRWLLLHERVPAIAPTLFD